MGPGCARLYSVAGRQEWPGGKRSQEGGGGVGSDGGGSQIDLESWEGDRRALLGVGGVRYISPLSSFHLVNKQLADKERVAAALENTHLLEVVNQCLSARS